MGILKKIKYLLILLNMKDTSIGKTNKIMLILRLQVFFNQGKRVLGQALKKELQFRLQLQLQTMMEKLFVIEVMSRYLIN